MFKKLLLLAGCLASLLIVVPAAQANDRCLNDPSVRGTRTIKCEIGKTCTDNATVCAISFREIRIKCPSGSTITNVSNADPSNKLSDPVRHNITSNNTAGEPAHISYTVGNQDSQAHKIYFTYTCQRAKAVVPGSN